MFETQVCPNRQESDSIFRRDAAGKRSVTVYAVVCMLLFSQRGQIIVFFVVFKGCSATETDLGLSNTQFSLRLRYEIVRGCALYIGINCTRQRQSNSGL